MGNHAGPRAPRPSRRGRGRRTPGGGPATTTLLRDDWEPGPPPLDLLPHRNRVTIRPRDEPPPLLWQVPGWWWRHLPGVVAVILWRVVLAVISWPH